MVLTGTQEVTVGILEMHFGRGISKIGFWTGCGVEGKRQAKLSPQVPGLDWCRAQPTMACGPHPVQCLILCSL